MQGSFFRFLTALIVIAELAIGLSSCAERKTSEEVDRLVKEWSGKEILFPDSLVYTRHGIDTVEYSPSAEKCKILIRQDSAGCVGCRLRLDEWMAFDKELVKEGVSNASLLFVFELNDHLELSYQLRATGYDHPICIDDRGLMTKRNGFPDSEILSVLLLDEYNRVLVVGNPLDSERMRKLYIQTLKNNK